jgi:ABC-type dipeptide/oligopeptide/nickel transport system permease subunit
MRNESPGAAVAIDVQPPSMTVGLSGLAGSRWSVGSILFWSGLAVALLFLASALLAERLAPFDPLAVDYSSRLKAPSVEHLLGTDEHGRDMLSRLIFGARISMAVSAGAVGLATAVGLLLGLTAGYFGGVWDGVVSRVMDGLFAFPSILLAILLMALVGPGVTSVILAIGIVSIPVATRVSRGAIIAEKANDHVEASRALGSSHAYIIFRCLVPNAVGPLLVLVSLSLAQALLAEAALSFLGLGASPPTPSWGSMLSTGRRYLADAPWYTLFPGMCIFLLVLAINLVGEGIRDRMDPRHRER